MVFWIKSRKLKNKSESDLKQSPEPDLTGKALNPDAKRGQDLELSGLLGMYCSKKNGSELKNRAQDWSWLGKL
jgi:hypothetical protein